MDQSLMDPELAEALVGSFPKAVDERTLAVFRAWVAELTAALAQGTSAVSSFERAIAGPANAPDVRVIVYAPDDRGTEPLPVIVHFHGGGYISGTADISSRVAEAYVSTIGCMVVSVDYRLAPETRHPGPAEDGYAALKWVAASAAELGIDPNRIAVAGESAGAGLAAAVCLLARDRGEISPCFQYLSEPMLDPRSADSDHPHVGVAIWNREQNRFGWSSLLGPAETTPSSASPPPALVENLVGLPPTFIHIGAIDLFLEESVEYARRLTRAGVSVELHVWPGAFHGFHALDAHVSREARRVAMTAMQRALRGESSVVSAATVSADREIAS